MTASTTAPNAAPQVAINDIGSAEDFLAAIDETIKYFNDGDIVSGTIVKVDRDEVLLDIGYKTEGVIPSRELSSRRRTRRVGSSCPRSARSTSAPGARSRRSRRRTASSRAPSSRSSRAA
jgi:ribosomal protein S1